MRKSLDFASFEAMLPTDQVQKKTERSHEENQERAYIAASRRTDRSLEARVQSARMASEIHKKRTGKGFRISEEIVLKEEMYEEEDDDLPRSYRLLGPSMQTTSPDMNHRVETYLSNKFAMSAMLARTNEEWRQNEINKLFAQSFPNIGNNNNDSNNNGSVSPDASPSHDQAQRHSMMQAQQQAQQQALAQQAQQLQQMRQMQQAQQMQAQQMHASYAQSNQYYDPRQQLQHQHQRGQSFSGAHQGHASPAPQQDYYDYRQRHHSAEAQFQSVPESPHHSNRSMSPIDLGSSRSAFTTELPADAKMLMGDMDANGAFQQDYQQYQNWFAADPSFAEVPQNIKTEQDDQILSPMEDSFSLGDMKWDTMAQSTAPLDEAWSTFINDGAWEADQAAAQ